MPEDAEPEDERRADPPATVRVERHARPDGHDPDARHGGALTPLPLPEGEVRDLVLLNGDPLGEVAVPAFRASDRVREEAVVDDADAHAAGSMRSDLRIFGARGSFGRRPADSCSLRLAPSRG